MTLAKNNTLNSMLTRTSLSTSYVWLQHYLVLLSVADLAGSEIVAVKRISVLHEFVVRIRPDCDVLEVFLVRVLCTPPTSFGGIACTCACLVLWKLTSLKWTARQGR